MAVVARGFSSAGAFPIQPCTPTAPPTAASMALRSGSRLRRARPLRGAVSPCAEGENESKPFIHLCHRVWREDAGSFEQSAPIDGGDLRHIDDGRLLQADRKSTA